MNKTADYQFTILVPIYNEEDNMDTLDERLRIYLPTCSRPACVLFVNDGSTDRSLEKIKEICSRSVAFYYISVNHGGLSAALKAGIDFTESKYVGYMDADLQTAPEDFNSLLRYVDEYEMVTGIRTRRKDSVFKLIQSRIANAYRRMMTHDGMYDTGCPLKVMHTVNAKRIPLFDGMHRFLPALIQLQGCKVKQVPVRHFPRTAGVSKYHLWNRLAGPFMDCFAYRWMKKRYINYKVEASNFLESRELL